MGAVATGASALSADGTGTVVECGADNTGGQRSESDVYGLWQRNGRRGYYTQPFSEVCLSGRWRRRVVVCPPSEMHPGRCRWLESGETVVALGR